MKMTKKCAALLLLLAAMLVFALPVYGETEEEAGVALYLRQYEGNKFPKADLENFTKGSIKQITIVQHALDKYSGEGNYANWVKYNEDPAIELPTSLGNGANINYFTEYTDVSSFPAGFFKVVNVDKDATETDIEEYIRNVTFTTPANAKVKLVFEDTNKIEGWSEDEEVTVEQNSNLTANRFKERRLGRIFYLPANDHYYEYFLVSKKFCKATTTSKEPTWNAVAAESGKALNYYDIEALTANKTLLGRHGYVTTINYPIEEKVLTTISSEVINQPGTTISNYLWLGAKRDDSPEDPALGSLNATHKNTVATSTSEWRWINENDVFYYGITVKQNGMTDAVYDRYKASAKTTRYYNWIGANKNPQALTQPGTTYADDEEKNHLMVTNQLPPNLNETHILYYYTFKDKKDAAGNTVKDENGNPVKEIDIAGEWHDYAPTNNALSTGYVVEYGGFSGATSEGPGNGNTGNAGNAYDNNYTITYVNVPSSYGGQKSYDYGESFTLIEPTSPMAGIKFVGWYTDANYTKKVTDISSAQKGDLTFYAKWDVTGTVVWADSENVDGHRPASVTLQLLKDGTRVDEATGVSTSHTWEGLQVFDESGNAINYSVTASADRYSSATSGLTVTLSHTPETVTVSGTITWHDDSDRDGLRSAIQVVLYRKDTVDGQEQYVCIDGPDSPNADGTYTFDAVNRYDNGAALDYEVHVTGADAYTGTKVLAVDKSDANSATNFTGDFTLTHVPAKINVTVKIDWSAVQAAGAAIPASVVGVITPYAPLTENSFTLPENNTWETEFSGVFVNAAGAGIDYSAALNGIDGYNMGAAAETTDANGDITFTFTPTANTYTLTLETRGELTSIPSDWNLDSGVYTKQFAYSLMALPTELQSDIKLKDRADWTFAGWYQEAAFTNAVTDEWLKTQTDNTTIYAKWTRDVTVNVVWNDSDNADGLRDSAVTITMPNSAQPWNPSTTDTQKTFTVPVHDDQGKVIQYTPDVVSTSYSQEATGTMDTVFTVKLSYTATPYNGDGELKVKLLWDDESNQDGKRKPVTVQLLADGVVVNEHDFGQADGECTFTGLLAKKLGADIVYTLRVPAVMTITDDQNQPVTGDLAGIYTSTETDGTGADEGKKIITLSLDGGVEKLNAKVSVQYASGTTHKGLASIAVNLNGQDFNVNTDQVTQIGTGLNKYENGVLKDYTLTAPVTVDDGYERIIAQSVLNGSQVNSENALVFEITLKANEYKLTMNDKYDLDGTPANGDEITPTYEDGKTVPTGYTYGTDVVLPNPSVPGMTFTGWEIVGDDGSRTKLDGDQNGTVLPLNNQTGNLTIKATYEPIAYVIEYAANDAVYTLDTTNPTGFGYYDAAHPVIAEPTPNDAGNRVFDGWYAYDGNNNLVKLGKKTADGKWTFAPAEAVQGGFVKLKTENQTPANVVTLYPRWLTNEMVVSYRWDDQNNQDGRRKDVTATLYAEFTVGGAHKKLAKETFVILANQDVTEKTFSDLDAYVNDDGVGDIAGKNPVTYSVVANLTTPGLSELYKELKDELKPDNPFAFRLYHAPEEALYHVKINWHDYNDRWHGRPQKLTVELYAEEGELFIQPPIEDLIQEIKAENWSVSWHTQINPTIRSAVQPIKFNVKLNGLPGYYFIAENTYDEATRTRTIMIAHEGTIPSTGDDSSLLLWGGLLAMCAAVLGYLGVKRRKHNG